MRRWATLTLAAGLALAGLPALAVAKGYFHPTWHPKPCDGGDCKADDTTHSGMPCEGLLCSFSSAKSMQPPVTAAQAAEMERAHAAAEAAKAAAAPAPAPTASAAAKPRRHVARKTLPKKAAPETAASSAPETTAAK